MSKYEWKLKSLAKGIDPDLAVQELERIESVYGVLSAEHLLNESRNNGAILHPLFEWQEDIAAEKFRLQQARFIINNVQVKIIKDGNISSIPVYEIVTVNGDRGYKNIQVMTEGDVQQVRKAAMRDLASIKAKIQAYESLEQTRTHIQDAMDTL